MTTIEKIEVRQREVELRSTFTTALRAVQNFTVVEVVINDSFIGEAVETPAITGDTLKQILQDCNQQTFVGAEVSDPIDFYRRNIRELHITSSAKAALDMAVHSLFSTFDGAMDVQTDVTVPIATLEQLPALITDRLEFSTFKIKLGNEPVRDLMQKVELIHTLHPNARLRIDPNQSWSVKLACDFLLALDGISIEYMEQPTLRRDFDSYRKIKECTGVPLMADESCFTEGDLEVLVATEAVDYINLKALKNGGISEVLHLMKVAESAGLKVSIGSMMEGERGIRAAMYCATQVSHDLVHDLDAAWWLKESELKYKDGWVVAE